MFLVRLFKVRSKKEDFLLKVVAGLVSAGVVPGAVVAGPALGLGLGLAGPGLTAKALGLVGSGIEGQWVPDINEKLHDDGSYKPAIYSPLSQL